jgi:hypothetical protein
MSETSPARTFPRRDEHGRVASLTELLVATVGGLVVGLVGLALIDGVFALIGIGGFGHASGWLAVILPALLFFDEIRAWRGYGVRFVVGPVGAAVGIGLGLVAAGLVRGLPPILSGAVGGAVAVVAYALIWFVGIRWLTGHRVEMGSS